jgi:hypothetical protein
MRLYAEFVLGARRDLGDPQTSVDVVDILGLRITDIYSGNWAEMMSLPLPDLYRRLQWSPPWGSRFSVRS